MDHPSILCYLVLKPDWGNRRMNKPPTLRKQEINRQESNGH